MDLTGMHHGVRDQRGVTFAEVLIALALAALVAGLVATILASRSTP